MIVAADPIPTAGGLYFAARPTARVAIARGTQISGGGEPVGFAVPASIPGFNRGRWTRAGLNRDRFRGLMGLAAAAGRRGLGLTCPAGMVVDTQGGDHCIFEQYAGNVPAQYIQSAPVAARAGTPDASLAKAAGCPCDDPYTCFGIRECDPWTGEVHFAYALPGGNAGSGADEWVLDSTGKWTWLGPNGQPATPPAWNPYPPSAAALLTAGEKPAAALTPTGGGASTSSPPTSNQPAAGAPKAATVQLLNSSRAGQPFQVGDNWTLTVTGSPGADVTGAAVKDGVDLGRTSYGKTDNSGVRVLSGTMAASTVGNWVEHWSVGGGPEVELRFSVAPAAASPPGHSTSGETGGGGATSTGNGGQPAGGPGGYSGGSGAAVTVSAFPWGLVLIALAAAYFLFGGRR